MNFNKIGILEIDGERVGIRPISIDYEYGQTGILKAEMLNIFSESNRHRKNNPIIKNVIFNNPATIVIWSDGTKTVVKCQEGDTYDAEKGLALCIAKKYLGNKGNFNNVFKKWLPEKPLTVEELGEAIGTGLKSFRDSILRAFNKED